MDKILLPFIGGPLDGKTAIPPEYSYVPHQNPPSVQIIDISVTPIKYYPYYLEALGSGFAMFYREPLIVEIGMTESNELFECESDDEGIFIKGIL